MSELFPKYDMNYPGQPERDLAVVLAIKGRSVPSVIRNGYDFTGWYADTDCKTPVIPDPYSGTTYYAGWKPWDAAKAEEIAAYEERLIKIKYRIARPKAYTWDSFVPYFRIANELIFDYPGNNRLPDDHAMALLEQLDELEKDLVQVCDPEDTVWYIWGENMAQAPDADSYDYFCRFDYPGFRPFLVPFMLPDQSAVKGNMIVIAGGGFAQRWNQTEGYAMAKAFNNMGYNAFVLQRRVVPSKTVDAYLDLQRSVRYLKYNAEKYGIGAIEHLATVGFSGGGMTIVGALEKHYGTVSPCVVYPEYIPDEVDAVNSDYQVAMPIYGGFAPKTDENPNFPALFVAVGVKDNLMQHQETAFFDFMYRHPEVDVEIHFFAGVPHGFATGYGAGPEHHLEGPGFVGADNWLKLADDFMMVRFGILPQTYERGQRK